MKITLLGDDPRLLAWVEALHKLGEHRLVIRGSGDWMRRIPNGSPGIQVFPWEDLSDSNTERSIQSHGEPVDGLIIGGVGDHVHQALRSLVFWDCPVLVLPHPRQPPELIYELILLDEENQHRLAPAFLDRFQPGVREFCSRFQAGAYGDLQFLQLSRVLPREPHTFLKPTQVEQAFFEDADLLRFLGGDYDRVTALFIGSSGSCSQANVTLSGTAMADAVWSITTGDSPGWRLELTGSRGTATLVRNEQGTILSEADSADTADGTTEPAGNADALNLLLSHFLTRCENPTQPDDSATGEFPSWMDLVRVVDLVEAVNRSARRRRTIDLHFESTSERSQFKTQMTTIGCAVLCWALFGTIIGLGLGKVLDPRDRIQKQAEAAGTLLTSDDFTAQGNLRPEAARQILTAVQHDVHPIVLVAIDPDQLPVRSIEPYRAAVQELLEEEELQAQVEVRPPAARWFRLVMIAIWIVVFAPLALFLFLQLLYPLTHSGTSPRGNE